MIFNFYSIKILYDMDQTKKEGGKLLFFYSFIRLLTDIFCLI